MKLTERKLKEFFPYNNRFIHYVAKYYNLNFPNQDVVDDARVQSYYNIHRLMKKDTEFESEEHMYGIVMSCIRYGILSAVSDWRKRKERLDIRPATDMVFNSTRSKHEEYNFWDTKLGSYDDEYDDVNTHIELLLSRTTNRTEKMLIELCLGGEHNEADLSEKIGVSVTSIRNAKSRVRNKIKQKIKDEPKKKNPVVKHVKLQPSPETIQREDGYRSLEEKQRKERSYSKTMSFLYPEEEVQIEIPRHR